MTALGGASESDDLKFDSLLISESFSQDNCRDYPLTACVSWLHSRVAVVSTWPHDFRMNRADLPRALTQIQDNLLSLYRKMNRLCEGPRSYLAACLEDIPETTKKYYGEFTRTYDRIGDALDEYKAYANHYETSLKEGKIPQTKPTRARRPDQIREDLFENLETLLVALRNLADSLEGLPARTADDDQDPPDEPRRRTA